jgi:hypothetical protein
MGVWRADNGAAPRSTEVVDRAEPCASDELLDHKPIGIALRDLTKRAGRDGIGQICRSTAGRQNLLFENGDSFGRELLDLNLAELMVCRELFLAEDQKPASIVV